MDENKISILAIIISDVVAVEKVNLLLHQNREYVLSRSGMPIKKSGINVISVILDAPLPIINSLSGKLGMIDGVSSKVLSAK